MTINGHLPACGIDLVAGGGMSGVFFMAPGDIGHERARKGVDDGHRERDGQHGKGEAAQTERGKFVEKRITPPKHSPHGKNQQTRRNERKFFIHALQRRGNAKAPTSTPTHITRMISTELLSTRKRYCTTRRP